MQKRLMNIVDNISDYFLELDERSAKFISWKYVPSVSFLVGAQYSAFFLGRRISSLCNLINSASNAVIMSSILIFTAVSCNIIYRWYLVMHDKKHNIDQLNKSNKLLWKQYGSAEAFLISLLEDADIMHSLSSVFPDIHYYAADDGKIVYVSQFHFDRNMALNKHGRWEYKHDQEYKSYKISSKPEELRKYFDAAYNALPDMKYRDFVHKILQASNKHLYTQFKEGSWMSAYFFNHLRQHKITAIECDPAAAKRVHLMDWLDQKMNNLRDPLDIDDIYQVRQYILSKQLNLAELQYTKADWKKLSTAFTRVPYDNEWRYAGVQCRMS